MKPNQAQSAAQFIRKLWDRIPVAGIILGTGSGDIAENIQIDQAFDYHDIPGFPSSTAMGHKGRLVCGTFADRPVVAMQGRFHLYEGYPVDQVTLPIYVMAELGISRLLVSNAAGGVNPKMRSGDIMLINSHLDFMLKTGPSLTGDRNSVSNSENGTGPRKPALGSPYDERLVAKAKQVGRENDFVVHDGVYAGLLGPNYETRAEYRMLRAVGGDVAGMSTVPEVMAAANLKIPVLAVSIITNVAKPDVLEPTSGQEVIDAAKVAAPNLSKIFAAVTALDH